MWATPLTYFTRAWVYPFSHDGRRPNLMVEPGAIYLERGVFYPFQFQKESNRYDKVERIDKVLRNPVRRVNGS